MSTRLVVVRVGLVALLFRQFNVLSETSAPFDLDNMCAIPVHRGRIVVGQRRVRRLAEPHLLDRRATFCFHQAGRRLTTAHRHCTCKQRKRPSTNTEQHTHTHMHTMLLGNLPFSNGAFLYFSSRFTAIASSRTRAAGYSFSTSHMSFLLSTNRSL